MTKLAVVAVLFAACSHPAAPAAPTPSPAIEPAGPLAGLAAITVSLRPDATHCNGVAVTVTSGDVPVVADDEAPLARVFAIAPPTGLDFGTPATTAASTQRFEGWVSDMTAQAQAATAFYSDALAQATEPGRKVIAAARIVQVSRHFATELTHLEIPLDVRRGEAAADKTAAYCGKLAEVAAPLLARATQIAQQCATPASSLPAGWWTSICQRV